jgi:hypothetical protein
MDVEKKSKKLGSKKLPQEIEEKRKRVNVEQKSIKNVCGLLFILPITHF